jgi:hypothetical protein
LIDPDGKAVTTDHTYGHDRPDQGNDDQEDKELVPSGPDNSVRRVCHIQIQTLETHTIRPREGVQSSDIVVGGRILDLDQCTIAGQARAVSSGMRREKAEMKQLSNQGS